MENKLNINKQNLQSYSYRCTGSMNGAYHKETINLYPDFALLSIIEKDSHNSDIKVEEYQVNSQILIDLKNLFVKHKMQNWQGKKFSKLFVADGKSKAYTFCFVEDEITFSAQIYPQNYLLKLNEIHELIANYKINSKRIPALLLNSDSKEKISLRIKEYSNATIHYLIINDTDKDYKFKNHCRLINIATKKLLLENEEIINTIIIHPKSSKEFCLPQKIFLDVGNYILECGDLKFKFEIK